MVKSFSRRLLSAFLAGCFFLSVSHAVAEPVGEQPKNVIPSVLDPSHESQVGGLVEQQNAAQELAENNEFSADQAIGPVPGTLVPVGPQKDHWFHVQSGSFTLADLEAAGFGESSSIFMRSWELFLIDKNPPHKTDSAIMTLYRWQGEWRRYGSGPVAIDPKTLLSGYFIVRSNANVQVGSYLFFQDTNVVHDGTTPINPTDIPWFDPNKPQIKPVAQQGGLPQDHRVITAGAEHLSNETGIQVKNITFSSYESVSAAEWDRMGRLFGWKPLSASEAVDNLYFVTYEADGLRYLYGVIVEKDPGRWGYGTGKYADHGVKVYGWFKLGNVDGPEGFSRPAQELNPGQDHYFRVSRGTLTLKDLTEAGLNGSSPTPAQRPIEVFFFSDSSPDKMSSAAETYYFWDGHWRQVGKGTQIMDQKLVSGYFMVRVRGGTYGQSAPERLHLPENVFFFGSTSVNSLNRPWNQPFQADHDHFYRVIGNTLTLHDLTEAGLLGTSAYPGQPTFEIFFFSGSPPDKTSSVSATYLHWNGHWRQVGQNLRAVMDDVPLSDYFIIRINGDPGENHLKLPENVFYFGSEPKEKGTAERPWDKDRQSVTPSEFTVTVSGGEVATGGKQIPWQITSGRDENGHQVAVSIAANYSRAYAFNLDTLEIVYNTEHSTVTLTPEFSSSWSEALRSMIQAIDDAVDAVRRERGDSAELSGVREALQSKLLLASHKAEEPPTDLLPGELLRLAPSGFPDFNLKRGWSVGRFHAEEEGKDWISIFEMVITDSSPDALVGYAYDAESSQVQIMRAASVETLDSQSNHRAWRKAVREMLQELRGAEQRAFTLIQRDAIRSFSLALQSGLRVTLL